MRTTLLLSLHQIGGSLRTLQIGDEWLPEREGGVARYYFELLRHLPADRASAVGLVVGSNEVAVSTQGRVQSFARPDAYLPTRLLRLRSAALPMMRGGEVDLLCCHFALYGIPLLDRLRAFPTVVHFHGPWAAESSLEGGSGYSQRAKANIERLVYSRARRLIVLSEAFRGELIHRYRIQEERIRTVQGGVDTERFNVDVTRQEARAYIGWPQDRPILLTMRRQVRRMGLENLVKAVGFLVPRHPDLLLLLGGSGPLAGALQVLIHELGLQRNVSLLGRVPDAQLPLAYRAANISIVPTQALEGFGLVTIESLASGTPVFVTPVGGLTEILRSFAPQCIFSSTSAKTMAGELGEALRGERHMPTEAECRAYSVERFSWNTIASQVVDVYEEIFK